MIKIVPIFKASALLGKTILQNLQSGLTDFGLTLQEHLFGATVFTSKFSEFGEINRAWEEVFNDDLPPPARSAIGVSELPLGALVEIEFKFWKDK